MKRLTNKNNGETNLPEANLVEAMLRLAAFEDIYEELAESLASTPAELEKLKAAGKEKTVRYRERFGQKLMNQTIVALFERHGISFDDEK